MKEIDVQTKVMEYLRSQYRGCVCLKLEDAKTVAIPDIYFAYRGASAWFEVKRSDGTGVRNPMQEYRIKKFNQNGIPAAFVESVDDVKKCLQDVKFMVS